jgi:hypothetical protein
MKRLSILLTMSLAGFAITGCGKEADQPKATPPATKPDLGAPGDASEMLPDESKATDDDKKPADAANTPSDTPAGGPELKPNPAPVPNSQTEQPSDAKSEAAKTELPEPSGEPSGKRPPIDDTVDDPEEE